MFRSAYPTPRYADGEAAISAQPGKIAFRHPEYPAYAQKLLILPACDKDTTINQELARVACAIVACNRFDGYITTDVDGHDQVSDSQLPLRENGYFFHVPRRTDDSLNLRRTLG